MKQSRIDSLRELLLYGGMTREEYDQIAGEIQSSNRKNLLVFFLTNLATQGALCLYFAVSVVRTGAGFGYLFLLVPAEAVILLAETAVFRRCFTGCTKNRAAGYAVAANLCSAIVGYAIMEPVWRWVVSIS